MSTVITGWGKCVPPGVLSNDDIAEFLDTSDEWIRTRTGIHERRISHVDVSELAYVAACRALAAAGLEPDDIDGIILTSASPELIIPNTASRLQEKLGVKGIAAMDINSGCCGFVYSMAVAHGLISTGTHKRMLIVGAERLSFFIDWTQRDSAVLFGDGAGAAIVEAGPEGEGLLAAELGCEAEAGRALMIPDFGSGMDRWTLDAGRLELLFDGQEIFKRAVRAMCTLSHSVLDDAGLTLEDVDLLIPHQANLRIIESVGKRLGFAERPDQVFSNLHRYGNTSAASIPLALVEALEQGRVKPGDLILFPAFGAGLTRAAMLMRWGQRVDPISVSPVELPPCELSARELIQPSLEFARQAPAGS